MRSGIAGFLFVLTALSITACGQKHTTSDDGTERVRIPTGSLSEQALATINFNPDHQRDAQFMYGFVEEARLNQLTAAQRDLLDPQPEAPITPDMYEGYHNYQALTAELQRLADEYPNLIRLETAGQSVQGRELWYVVISDNAQTEEPEPKFIYHANMHGDEVVGRELMIYLIRHMAAEYGRDARITQIINNVQLFVMPSMNPDGFELGRRTNARNYDINRNLPDRFDSPSDTVNGRQIEVQHMMRLAEVNHFVFGINWHGGEICFNLPWGNISNSRASDRYGDDALFHPIGREYTQLNRPMYANHRASFDHGLTYGYEWYPVNGGINDWFNYFRRSVHSVVELTVTKWPNASTLDGHWNDNREAMITYLWRGLRGVHLEIRDASGALVQNPVITVANAPAQREVRYNDGYVHRLTADGAQQILIEAPGFAPATVAATASYFDGTYLPVTLKR